MILPIFHFCPEDLEGKSQGFSGVLRDNLSPFILHGTKANHKMFAYTQSLILGAWYLTLGAWYLTLGAW